MLSLKTAPGKWNIRCLENFEEVLKPCKPTKMLAMLKGAWSMEGFVITQVTNKLKRTQKIIIETEKPEKTSQRS